MTTTALESQPTAPVVPPSNDAAPDSELFPIRLRLPEAVIAAGPDACEGWFWDVCISNQDSIWQMELNGDGELELMPPTNPPSDEYEGESFGELRQWNITHGRPGIATGPSSAYRLANGAIRCPDAAWSPRENVRARQREDRGPRPYCPDFVVEIRSTSQSRPSDLGDLLNKMQEYLDNGAQLGWLIDPLERTVRIYRAGADEPELQQDPETLDGENVLPGFTFAVQQLIFDLV